MISKVTTKQGDQGQTSTLAGKQLSKADALIECTGQLDALRAQTALVRLRLLEQGHQEAADFLYWLLHCFFIMGAQISDYENEHPEWRQGEIGPEHITKLEAEQQRLENDLELPDNFIVSATTILSARIDVLTTTVRSFERSLVRFQGSQSSFKGTQLLTFINRLSDYCFILARSLESNNFDVVDYSMLIGQ